MMSLLKCQVLLFALAGCCYDVEKANDVENENLNIDVLSSQAITVANVWFSNGETIETLLKDIDFDPSSVDARPTNDDGQPPSTKQGMLILDPQYTVEQIIRFEFRGVDGQLSVDADSLIFEPQEEVTIEGRGNSITGCISDIPLAYFDNSSGRSFYRVVSSFGCKLQNLISPRALASSCKKSSCKIFIRKYYSVLIPWDEES